MPFESFGALLRHFANLTPAAPALKEGGIVLTYAELYEAVRGRADELSRTGMTCLGVLCDGSAACVIEIFAAASAGLQTVLLDPNQPDDVLAELLTASGADLLWGDEELTEVLSPALTGRAEDPAGKVLFFTSGTTSRAKAVVLTEKSLCRSAWNGSSLLPLRPEDTLLCVLPLSHVFGFVCGLLWALSCGACAALSRGPRHYAEDFLLHRPTAVSVVPLLLRFLLARAQLNPELSLVLVGAGDCPPSLLEAARSRGLTVSFGYGLTETSSGVALSRGGDAYALDICPDYTVRIAEDGEIVLSAPECLMRGYYKRPEETAAVLRGGELFTGDLGFLDEDGRLHVTGRKKEILVLPDGTKIFLPEYERAFKEALGTDEAAAVLEDGRPVLVLSAGISPEEAEARLRPVISRLPRGQQPARIRILDQKLPRTAAGKIKRWEIPAESVK